MTFKNAKSAFVYLVLRSPEKHVLVTCIRKIEKVRVYARPKRSDFTNFGHIHELFTTVTQEEK